MRDGDYCDKTGTKIEISRCTDTEELVNPPPKAKGMPKHTRHERERLHKRKLKRLYNITGGCYPSGVWQKNKGKPNEYFCRYWRGNRSKYLKRQSNKAVRRYRGKIKNGGGYKKLYDFWWLLW